VKVDLYYETEMADQCYRFSEFCAVHEIKTTGDIPDKRALYLSREGLALKTPGFAKPLYIKNRPEALKPFKTNLVRACLPKDRLILDEYTILDGFSGFGGDALTLAMTRCRLTLVEKDPLVWLMLRELTEGIPNIQLNCRDCMELMEEDSRDWDTIYLDPMFHRNRKSALPNLELQHLRALSTDEPIDFQSLIELSRSKAKRRVVIKRKLKDPIWLKPNFSIEGKLVRFDVYHGAAA
jgi:16S rRNA (guanine1516-N2)-methyltransferase